MRYLIDTDELAKLQADAEKVQLQPDAEKTLSAILMLEEIVTKLKDTAKAKLLEEGRKLNPNFKSWEADAIKVSMRPYGAKYYVSEAELALAPKELYTTEATVVAPNEDYGAITKALEVAGFAVKMSKGTMGEKLAIKRTVDTKAVDKWEKQHRGLPAGIVLAPDRPVSLNFSLKDKGEGGEENE